MVHPDGRACLFNMPSMILGPMLEEWLIHRTTAYRPKLVTGLKKDFAASKTFVELAKQRGHKGNGALLRPQLANRKRKMLNKVFTR